ncbi:hypothetical protein KBY57_13745 [Cyanobium sp. Aljojuca 7D2]|uniref:hypothetical protein n=1 Tax=Cyanobium sp. Aljojuca 7D2 TaxID=2823698 RepID=UPI0020CD041F|nr:hypothetical protein [Cyanobium sp. Aljojuca 7D2]MCP9892107.1 hypothetical protein [Cyanobium sp. Aljojuca 7D2]
MPRFREQIDAESAIHSLDAAGALDVLEQLVPEWLRGGDSGRSRATNPVEVVQG